MRAALATLALVLAGTSMTAMSAPAVDELLQTSLRGQYPSITRWEISRFGGARDIEDTAAGSAHVVTLGPRSAVRVDGRLRWYVVAGFQPVMVTTRAFAPGEAIDAGAAVLEEKNVLGLRCEPLVDAVALQAQRAVKPLRQGDIICSNSIEPRPDVARGDEVLVRYVGQRVVLVTKGIAQADGSIGEELLVSNPHSRDAFRALVSGAKEVTIHE